MAKTLDKTAKRLLSVGLHLVVLTGMVLAYDAGIAAAREHGLVPPPKEAKETTEKD